MSTALKRSVQRSPVTTQRPLKLITSPVRRTRTFPFICMGILFVGVVAVLLANIFVSNTTYKINDLSQKNEDLQSERDRLSEDIAYRQSPQNVHKAARQMGLVPADKVYFVTTDGKVVEAKEDPGKKVGTVPGPRADTRDDVRPNLRSDEKLPAIGESGKDLEAPTVKTP
ncbi:hypothetical protein QP572_07650 [Brevibacterium sp. UMB10442]|nr:hypothetical protein [Brevibacterium sp. UMB10442]